MTDNGEINRLVYSYSGPDLMPMLEALLREQACRRHQDTIMTTIPDDIMRVADNIANERFALGLRVENVQELSDAIADAILAERERVATHLFDRDAFMTAVSGNGDPHVKIQFKTLKEMQSFYLALCELSRSAIMVRMAYGPDIAADIRKGQQ